MIAKIAKIHMGSTLFSSLRNLALIMGEIFMFQNSVTTWFYFVIGAE